MFFRSSLAVRALSALALGLPALALPQGAPAYDYVVVGSGPGGGVVASNLALAGHSVLLIEAGRDDSDDIKTTVPALEHPRTDSLQWSFFARHYADDDSNRRFRLLTWLLPDGSYWVGKGADAPDGAVLKGVWYPRGSTLGGSAIVNAAAAVLPNDADWDEMAALAGDDSWSHGPMRKVFERIEKNYHLPADTPGHGFDGWMEIDQGASSYYSQSPGRLALLDTLAQSLVGDVGGKEALLRYLERDANFEGPSRDDAAEPYGLPAHKPDGRRWSPRDLIHATVNSTSRLQLQLESLATRILFDDDDDDKSGAAPRAVGVEFLEGAGVYQGTWKYNATTAPKGTTKRAYARKEVIVSGGVFNSPQLLQLSGIGNATHLRSLGIAVVADLAGVGLNMRDNQELPVAGRSPVNITLTQDDPLWPSCTRGAPGDPCLELWYAGKGPYRGPPGNSECSFFRSDHSPNGKRDVLTFGPPGVLRGFAPPTGQTDLGLFTDSPDTLWRSIARMSPQNNAGYVRIASNDPTALPDINLNHYAAGGDVDVGAMMDTVAWVRRGFAALPAPYGPILETIEPPCPSGYDPKTGVCSVPDEDAQWIREQTFGHHAVGTCKMGTEDDALAVVDAKFRVFGVQGLRVVDGSVFPIAPGAFPVLPTVMLGQKASDTILEDA